MAKIYYRQIKSGKMTLEDVPELWRSSVQKMMEQPEG